MPLPFIKRLQHLLEYGGLRILAGLLGRLPLKPTRRLATLFGLLAYHVLKIRRRVSMANLRQALGTELPEKEIKKICRDSYIHITTTFLEALTFSKLDGRINNLDGTGELELLRKNIAKGRGVIMVSGHLGNWELLGVAIAAAGIPVTGVGARQSNPYVDAFIYQSRTKLGMKVVRPDASTKHLVRTLKNNGVIGLVSDQNAGESGVFVEFFGRPASTPQGAAQLALKYRAPILVMATVRTPTGSYRNIIIEVETKEGDTVNSITQRYTTILEEIIRKYPEQYFWMHRRWKTRPPGQAEKE